MASGVDTRSHGSVSVLNHKSAPSCTLPGSVAANPKLTYHRLMDLPRLRLEIRCQRRPGGL
jgi:hypothetical protein